MLLAFAVSTQGAKVTPMEKVIGLLKDLSAKVAKEGKEEAAAYDKYACFCKEQADGKLYAIEKSQKKIKRLTAEIDELDSFISTTDAAIGKLAQRISGLDAEIEKNENA